MSVIATHCPALLLRVSNGNQLESGCEASHRFSLEGGRIGSAAANDWRIQDGSHAVAAVHFEVVWRDGAFCLHGCGQPLQLNSAPLEQGRDFVRLLQGDEISVGALTLKVFISLTGDDIQDALQTTPESLIAHYSNPLESLLETETSSEKITAPALEQTIANSWTVDPLSALQSESLTQAGEAGPHPEEALARDQHRAGAITTSALSDHAREQAMDQAFMELPHIGRTLLNQEESADRERQSQQYIALTPFMRGLDAPLAMENSQQANDFLEEAGRALQATIRGLLILQRQQDALSDKHLRPLEDNPLRLGLDYETTLNVLFAAGKSPVHLSAPEAVAESLRNMRLHHQANQLAIAEALRIMLDAFAPARLMARFAQYRRSSERGEMDAAWAWEMYSRYYEELSSSRQQGFEKLFNEVYAQAYDRSLRQGQLENRE